MSESSKSKIYSTDEVKVRWKPDACIHAKKCQALPEVFNPNNRPWIDLSLAATNEIIKTVKTCPSGALTLVGEEKESTGGDVKITVLKDGPVLVKGNLEVSIAGKTENMSNKQIALCRCGASENKPYCDGSHTKIGFTAD
ncbi:(4Fe-4S)-binding protein [Flammeovirga yaeyamensis]|uniref:(4Fe-4S)-binding protein n=1 Tax=Flammeovirga yaeyamensis TaxID=367791 RepID=A0AAX1N157_9BACT|nr:(4Fe-4S)-binding protein [Flammeovirga yaeyamensis]MBB3698310.1 putative Fe-S cluster protein YjdI [Flammeovirga yaeyamensis]NMF34337.1 hypothetical protein [Flammeovirga yaeyamensis]QWG01318.1 (4Fe-4S)-binding protein [Flammeovirga yaeyamensis]